MSDISASSEQFDTRQQNLVGTNDPTDELGGRTLNGNGGAQVACD